MQVQPTGGAHTAGAKPLCSSSARRGMKTIGGLAAGGELAPRSRFRRLSRTVRRCWHRLMRQAAVQSPSRETNECSIIRQRTAARQPPGLLMPYLRPPRVAADTGVAKTHPGVVEGAGNDTSASGSGLAEPTARSSGIVAKHNKITPSSPTAFRSRAHCSISHRGAPLYCPYRYGRPGPNRAGPGRQIKETAI